MNMDPLAEQYSEKSTYLYSLNNPILFNDPDGQIVDVSNLWNKIKNEKNKGDADDARWILAQLICGLSDISGLDIGLQEDESDGKMLLYAGGGAKRY